MQSSVQFSCSVMPKSLWPSMQGFPVHHQLQELAQTYIHLISDAIQTSHMQSTPCEMPGWMKHMLESRLPGEISINSNMQMTKHHGRKWRGTKEPLDEGERGEWKSWLKIQHSKNEDHGTRSHHFIQKDGETMETVTDFILLGSKIAADGDCSHEIKRHLILGRKLWQT